MANEDDAPFCKTCYDDLPARYFALSRRSEVMSVKHVDGKAVQAIDVFYDEIVRQFCSLFCWKAAEPEFIELFELNETYPAFAWTALCSRCCKSVNRTQPYVTLNRFEIEIIEKPWWAVGKVFDDREFAVLCNDCFEPVIPEAEAEIHEECTEGAECVSVAACKLAPVGSDS